MTANMEILHKQIDAMPKKNLTAMQIIRFAFVSRQQFEREGITERVRDKMVASRKKGKWVGGTVPFGYKVESHKLVPDDAEAAVVNRIYNRYLEIQSPKLIVSKLNHDGILNHNGHRWDTQAIQLLEESVTIYENSVKLELKTSGLKSVSEAYGAQNQ